MQYHKLKTWPEFFDAVKSGEKTFEVRKNDRHFQVGDWLCLMKFDPDKNIFLGDTVTLKVLYILPGGAFGVEAGFVVMGLFRPDLMTSLRELGEFDESPD